MENVPTNKRELAPELMARVDGCAYIFKADRPDKINAIMEGKGVTEAEAGRIYTLGALKDRIRQGRAKNYRGAIDVLEAEQVGDRGCLLTRTVNADRTASVVAHYQRINNSTPMLVNHVDVVRMAWARMDNQPLTVYAQPENWRVEVVTPKENKRVHAASVGKVLGTMYTEMEFRQELSDPVYECSNAVIQKNLEAFFKEYVSRLSKTVKSRLDDLSEYVSNKSNGDELEAEKAIKNLTSAKGRTDPETSKLSVFVDHLHRHFEHKDALTCPEFTELLLRYGKDID
jgi:hypothetical protein